MRIVAATSSNTDQYRSMGLALKEALQKAANYCARQERCHHEVRDKLYQGGLYGEEVESVIADLISNDFLNEQRFAEAFAVGKFRQKYWGKRKIVQGLKAKRVPDVLINAALIEIPDDEYLDAILKVATKRAKVERAIDPFIAKQRLIKYLVQRGFEAELARRVMDEHNPFS